MFVEARFYEEAHQALRDFLPEENIRAVVFAFLDSSFASIPTSQKKKVVC